MAEKLSLFAIYLIFAYLGSSILSYLYRKTIFFNKWTMPKYHYLLLLDLELLSLMLKNHSTNEQGKIVGFEDMKGNLLPASKIPDLLHERNVNINLNLFMTHKNVNDGLKEMFSVSFVLFDQLSKINKLQDKNKYEALQTLINRLYLSVRSSLINFESNQQHFLVDFKQYNEPKTIKEMKVIKFLTI